MFYLRDLWARTLWLANQVSNLEQDVDVDSCRRIHGDLGARNQSPIGLRCGARLDVEASSVVKSGSLISGLNLAAQGETLE